MHNSFSLVELIFVIIIVGVLTVSSIPHFSSNSLSLAADQVIYHIKLTQSLALKDDKFQPFPLDDSKKERNRSKYYFKQWWQIRFAKDKKNPKNLWYEIFSDIPNNYTTHNFDKLGYSPNSKKAWEESYAKDSKGLYLSGKCGGNIYPNCYQVNNFFLDLILYFLNLDLSCR